MNFEKVPETNLLNNRSDYKIKKINFLKTKKSPN